MLTLSCWLLSTISSMLTLCLTAQMKGHGKSLGLHFFVGWFVGLAVSLARRIYFNILILMRLTSHFHSSVVPLSFPANYGHLTFMADSVTVPPNMVVRSLEPERPDTITIRKRHRKLKSPGPPTLQIR